MSSLPLLLLLLSLSIHASDGRHISARARFKDSSIASRINSIKAAEDPKADEPLASPKPPSGDWTAETQGSASSEAPNREAEEFRETESSWGDRTPPLATVSWHVPREKQFEHPGFNVDYDGPKTHPPSHN